MRMHSTYSSMISAISKTTNLLHVSPDSGSGDRASRHTVGKGKGGPQRTRPQAVDTSQFQSALLKSGHERRDGLPTNPPEEHQANTGPGNRSQNGGHSAHADLGSDRFKDSREIRKRNQGATSSSLLNTSSQIKLWLREVELNDCLEMQNLACCLYTIPRYQ